MADEYIDLNITADELELAVRAYERLQQLVPGWQPSSGNFEALLIEASARIAAETAEVAALVPAAIFRYFGQSLLGINQNQAVSAQGNTTWTMIDSVGHTIPAGTLVSMTNDDGDLVTFQVVNAVTVPPGSSVTAAGEVLIEATDAGLASSGLTGAVDLVDPLDFVDSIAIVGATAGGIDQESDVDYLDRLSRELRLLSRRPILPRDYETLAKTQPNVERAVAIDGYDAVAATYDNDRTITVAVADAAGQPVPNKTDIDALFQANREVNFLVYVIDPTYTTVSVTVTVKAYEDYALADVEAAVEAAVADWLSPATWGRPEFEGDESSWVLDTKVRYLDLAHVVRGVPGVHYVVSLTAGIGAGAQSAADVTMTGPAPLPTPGTISCTAT